MPPASGKRTPSAANVRASGTESASRATQATIEAGPAASAAREGMSSTPGPSTAPTYRAVAARVERERAMEAVSPQNGGRSCRLRPLTTPVSKNLPMTTAQQTDRAPGLRRSAHARRAPVRGPDLQRRARRAAAPLAVALPAPDARAGALRGDRRLPRGARPRGARARPHRVRRAQGRGPLAPQRRHDPRGPDAHARGRLGPRRLRDRRHPRRGRRPRPRRPTSGCCSTCCSRSRRSSTCAPTSRCARSSPRRRCRSASPARRSRVPEGRKGSIPTGRIPSARCLCTRDRRPQWAGETFD